MTHVLNFIDTVVALAFMEVIGKPVIVRVTKKLIKKADHHIEIIPDWIHSKQED